MYINTELHRFIYNFLCDEQLFKVGDTFTSREVYDKLFEHINSINAIVPNNPSKDDFYHTVRQVLQTRNNSVRNTNRNDYLANNAIIRDIGNVTISNQGQNGRSLYTFGCLYKNTPKF